MTIWSRLGLAVMGFAFPTVAIAQGSGPGAAKAPAQVAAGAIDPSWLSFDAATRTVKFKLIAGMTGGAKSPFNFNGFTSGEFTLTVPQDATVVISFENRDGTPHSAEVIGGDGPLPSMGGNPAIPRAYTKQATEGIAQFGTDLLRFKASPAGSYRLFCGVPGHGQSGMWIRFTVSPQANAPAMALTPGSP